MIKNVLLLFSLFAALCSVSRAQSTGYVTYPNVYKFLPIYKEHQEEAAQLSKVALDSMRTMEKLRDSLDRAYVRQIGILDSAQLAQLEIPLNDLYEKMERYQDFVLQRNWKNRKTCREEEIKALIQELKAFNPKTDVIIVEKRGIIHCPNCNDLTEKFRQYMIKKYNIELTPWYETYEE